MIQPKCRCLNANLQVGRFRLGRDLAFPAGKSSHFANFYFVNNNGRQSAIKVYPFSAAIYPDGEMVRWKTGMRRRLNAAARRRAGDHRVD